MLFILLSICWRLKWNEIYVKVTVLILFETNRTTYNRWNGFDSFSSKFKCRQDKIKIRTEPDREVIVCAHQACWGCFLHHSVNITWKCYDSNITISVLRWFKKHSNFIRLAYPQEIEEANLFVEDKKGKFTICLRRLKLGEGVVTILKAGCTRVLFKNNSVVSIWLYLGFVVTPPPPPRSPTPPLCHCMYWLRKDLYLTAGA